MESISRTNNINLNHALEAAWRNHREISNNIANIHTKGYQAKRIEADLKLMRDELSLQVSNPLHIEMSSAADKNFMKETKVENLTLDTEMAELSKNNLFYQTLVESIVRRDRMAKIVSEGR